MILSICANPSVDSFWSFDSIVKGSTNRSTEESFYPGGKGIHVAFALNELNQRVNLLGFWGGQTGKWLREKCRNKNISCLGPKVREWTRLCIINRSTTDWDETQLLGKGPSIDKKEADNFFSIFEKQLDTQNIKAVTISGSVPEGINEDYYYHLVKKAKSNNVPVFLDASGRLLQKALVTKPYAIHINHNEGKELCGSDNPIEISKWLSEFCTIATVTAGADGLYMLFDEKIYHASCYIDPSSIHSTIGAGDCLLAGLCSAWLNKDTPVEWSAFATACGSANCIHPELGMISKKDVKELTEKVEVEKINL